MVEIQGKVECDLSLISYGWGDLSVTLDFHSKTLTDRIVDVGVDIVGSALMAVGLKVFSAPNRIAPGGVIGIATILNYVTGLRLGMLVLMMNIPLLILAYRYLGRRFTLNTLRTVLISTVMIDYVMVFLPPYTGDPLLAALFGGVLSGAGGGLVFSRGSTTGGADIVVKMILRKYPHFSTGKIILALNGAVLLTAAYVYQNIETALYGLIMTFASGKVVDALLYGFDVAQFVFVISHRNEEISEAIIAHMHRGATLIGATGAYTHAQTQVLLCVVRKQELYRLKKLVESVDPDAFVIVTEAGEILGKGFKSMTG
jgi:uncharacterized membrane-anchored protein YitT (DUF2179 family)